MIEFIMFILPTIIAIIIHDNINDREKNIYSILKNVGGYCCLNNLIIMAILFLYQNDEIYLNEHIHRFNFVFKYFVLSCVVATILPIVIEFIKKNVSIKIVFKEVKNEESN